MHQISDKTLKEIKDLLQEYRDYNDYEAEYYHLKDGISEQKAENEHLYEKLQDKERTLQYYYGFEAACKLILGKVS